MRWRCQRGSRELELMLLAYLERRYPQADIAEQAAFQRLLELPEHRLQRCLLGQGAPHGEAEPPMDRDLTCLAGQIRSAYHAGG
ncbi:succinate dehydrogenase assembly factor 2 [Methylogaea oryzae]|uniref:FAD assembly factor SdhE n=1 Tax=Methylogaea oryzae TaxID=1295382 RepID=UPI0020D0C28A|nr:succinate dehydrogenase assembly factor 2 [Methylogaea oryzae]